MYIPPSLSASLSGALPPPIPAVSMVPEYSKHIYLTCYDFNNLPLGFCLSLVVVAAAAFPRKHILCKCNAKSQPPWYNL